jgi:arginyl-tRNA synthetase
VTPEELIRPVLERIIEREYKVRPESNLIQFQKTRKEFQGDITLVVFPLLKTTGKAPEETAGLLGRWLEDELIEVSAHNVVKGFLNLSLSSAFWIGKLQDIAQNSRFGFQETGAAMTLVEYASPNTNKPLHLGHLRNIFLGDSVSRILHACGDNVRRVQVINDRGIHICKSMLAWQRFGNGETPATSGLKGDHLVGKYYVAFDKAYRQEMAALKERGMSDEEAEKDAPILKDAQEMLRKWEAGDPEVVQLWLTMNGWVYDGFNASYARMGVEFDKLYYESDTYLLGKQVVDEGLQKGVFYRKDDGSVWIDLTEDGLDHKLLLRKDGTAVYITQDIGTAILRSRDFPDMQGMIYTVGNEQDYHFKVLFLILKKLGYGWAEQCYHLSYGMVDLPSGKMKSREGTVVDADDLMQEMVDTARESTEALGKLENATETEKQELYEMVGMAALKYFLLKVDPKKRMLFDPKESIDFQGHTGPFIQYTHARIRSLIARSGVTPAMPQQLDGLLPEERMVIKTLSEFPQAVAQAGRELSPAVLANYLYDLVKEYNQFYQNVPVLKESDSARLMFRLVLSLNVADVTKKGMQLLGISVPERM